jgi:hypothetical protein
VAYAYDDAGRMTTATLPASTGIVSSYSSGNANRLTGISHVKDGQKTGPQGALGRPARMPPGQPRGERMAA